jgi:uncharacterized protein GlcG (DUF336 family)
MKSYPKAMAAAMSITLTLAAGGVYAEPLPMQRYLPVSVAIEAALAALKECTEKGLYVSVEVMNHNAMVLVTLHHELATLHSAYSAHAKAYTILSQSYSTGETTTAQIVQRITRDPAAVARYQGIPGMILAPGGMLIRAGTQAVGAIGVGGTTGPVNDDLCARAGVEKIKDRLAP